ncbi:Vi polysaccharide biosynthesis UDP-N-acetylglucosamine C-6 dehydrogenase TviB [Nocardioides sp. AE5]|uniref:Vi polysaccharide biosynthesis UDP-N-acetylglucosamine C-6 dehydrogenase TviB n=1 Tax=Nocardioides sp. AE5 TaxID=2962573 RepID=UPI0028810F6A|nr:Vi polysaccharide biosynthesis UDP-N-acetylglucosamine C-6 dehydrogenase TviB [Nocardioides sp. AE5]MDT0202645.1 Vi polysaccharide biosynthesis UDP-N-acetylglucosamine C-6 dehydrogenase TviB [Nocardioides sp. AE5]
MSLDLATARIGVIGLGYVGLPLAVSFSKKYDVVGFDINTERIAELNAGHDRTRELSAEELAEAGRLTCSADPATLDEVNVFIITTPTPIDEHKNPDLTPVLSATRTVAAVLNPGDTVIYESTVYPGATEEDCVPLLEELSGLTFNKDFYVGYSPERINPGDKEHRFENILKITSGSTPEAATFIDGLYSSVVTAGTHLAPSIKVAEAAKVIENTQRDVNIALINELALIFNLLDIDTKAVLEAAGTKWNFLKFQPGLVGGHCIGVDPYYLTHKAQAVGYHPEVIVAGRRLNDSMGEYAATRLVRTMIAKNIDLRDARVLVLGLTFKENTPDLRNTRVVDIVAELEAYGLQVDVHDPWIDAAEAKHEYDIDVTTDPQHGTYDGIVLAVAHNNFRELGAPGIHAYGKPDHVLFDLKSVLDKEDSDLRL